MNNLSRARAASERPRASASASAVQSRPAARADSSGQARRRKLDARKASNTVLEFSDAIHGEISRCAKEAVDQAELLESIGEQSFELVSQIYGTSDAGALRHRSHLIRGLVVHSLVVLAELQHVAGRLDALAVMREAERANDEPEDL